MEPFAIHCTTCKARLIGKDESVVGDILSCPKCGSMVHVVPPAEWRAASEPESPAVSQTSRSATHATPPPLAPRGSEIARPPAAPPALPPRSAAPPGDLAEQAASEPLEAPPVAEPDSDSPEPAAEVATVAKRRDWTLVAAGIGSGVLLGALAWLAIWLQAPRATSVAAAPALPLAAEQPAPAPPVETSPVETQPAETPHAETQPAQPQPQPTTVLKPATASANAPPQASDEAAVQSPAPDEAPLTAQPAPQPEAQPAAAADDQGELKLDPVARAADESPQPVEDGEESTAQDAPTASVESTDPEQPTDDEPSPIDISPGEPAPLPADEIERRLGMKLARVDFSGVSLGHLAGFLSDVSGARVVLDEPSLAKVGKSRKTPVTIRLNGTTPLAILQAATEQTGLSYAIDSGRITLSARGP